MLRNLRFIFQLQNITYRSFFKHVINCQYTSNWRHFLRYKPIDNLSPFIVTSQEVIKYFKFFDLIKVKMSCSLTLSGDIIQLVDCLKVLQTAKYDTHSDIIASCDQSDQVLQLIYDLGIEKVKIPSKDKAIIGPLLESSLKSIEIAVKRDSVYKTRVNTEMLRRRSALQFLIDEYGDFPAKTPGKKLSDFFPDIREFIEILDDVMAKCKDREYPEDEDSDREEAADVPASHTWWKDN